MKGLFGRGDRADKVRAWLSILPAWPATATAPGCGSFGGVRLFGGRLGDIHGNSRCGWENGCFCFSSASGWWYCRCRCLGVLLLLFELLGSTTVTHHQSLRTSLPPSPSSHPPPPPVQVDDTSNAMARADVAIPKGQRERRRNSNSSGKEVVLQELALRDTPSTKREELFKKKLELCTICRLRGRGGGEAREGDEAVDAPGAGGLRERAVGAEDHRGAHARHHDHGQSQHLPRPAPEQRRLDLEEDGFSRTPGPTCR